MSVSPKLWRILLQMVLQAPGGAEWSKLIEERPELDVYLAGGCVRDELLNRKVNPKDFDVFLGGKGVEESLEHLARTGHLDCGPFGSPRWHPNANDKLYYDVIPITRFFNGLWRCENMTDVLNQFDFTANAVALNLKTGELLDPQNGKRDILAKIMRAVRFDYPDQPIAPKISLTRPEVVWFRILHYSALLDFRIDPVTLDWLRANRHYATDADRFREVFFQLHPQWTNALNQV
jgi:hypothetical protein